MPTRILKIRYAEYAPQAWVLQRCFGCKTSDVELCNDGMCRTCHKSLTFDDCVTGRWEARIRASRGLPPQA